MLKWLALAVVVIILDQAAKLSIASHLTYGQLVPIIPGCFSLTLVYNMGAAFSFLANAGGWQRHFFTVLALVVAVVIIGLLRKHHQQPRFAAALGLILGGALGNVIDRVAYGHVIDFILVYWNSSYFPAFNVADSASVSAQVCSSSIRCCDRTLREKKTQ